MILFCSAPLICSTDLPDLAETPHHPLCVWSLSAGRECVLRSLNWDLTQRSLNVIAYFTLIDVVLLTVHDILQEKVSQLKYSWLLTVNLVYCDVFLTCISSAKQCFFHTGVWLFTLYIFSVRIVTPQNQPPDF